MKQLICLFIFLSIVFVSIPADALDQGYIYLPNGQTMDARNLTDEEIAQAVEVAVKSMKIIKNEVEVVETAVDMVNSLDPENLNEWRMLITGTIKDVCNDLSITVNDFVRTPVGFGVAMLIAYKVAGQDLLSEVLDIIIMVPLWMFITMVLLYMGWYFYSMKTVYAFKYDKNSGKLVEKTPSRVERYEWDKDINREGLAWAMAILWILTTVISLAFILG